MKMKIFRVNDITISALLIYFNVLKSIYLGINIKNSLTCGLCKVYIIMFCVYLRLTTSNYLLHCNCTSKKLFYLTLVRLISEFVVIKRYIC